MEDFNGSGAARASAKAKAKKGKKKYELYEEEDSFNIIWNYLKSHIKSSSLILFKSSIFIRFNNYFLSDSSNMLITLLTLSAFNS